MADYFNQHELIVTGDKKRNMFVVTVGKEGSFISLTVF